MMADLSVSSGPQSVQQDTERIISVLLFNGADTQLWVSSGETMVVSQGP